MNKVIIDERFDASLKLLMSGNVELAEQIGNAIKEMPDEFKMEIRKMLSENPSLDDSSNDEFSVRLENEKLVWEAELSSCGLEIRKYGPIDKEAGIEIGLIEKSEILEEIVSIEDKEDCADVGTFLKVFSFEDGSGYGIIGEIEYIVSKKGNSYYVSVEEDLNKELKKYLGVTKSINDKHKIDLYQIFSKEEIQKAKEEELEM